MIPPLCVFFPLFLLSKLFLSFNISFSHFRSQPKECLSCGSLPPALTEGTPAAEFKDLSPRAIRSGKMCLRVPFPEPLTLRLHSLYCALSLPDTNYPMFLFSFFPFLFLATRCVFSDLSFPTRDWTQASPQQGNHGVLSTGPPGKFLVISA